MSFLGRTPSNAPLTTADIPDGIIVAADLAPNSVDSSELVDGSIDTSHIADNQVTLAKMAGGTDGQIITYDASGDPVAVGPGTDGQVLTSTGAGSPPAFEAIAGGGKVKQITSAINNTTASSVGSAVASGCAHNITVTSGNDILVTAVVPWRHYLGSSEANYINCNYWIYHATDGASYSVIADTKLHSYADDATSGLEAGYYHDATHTFNYLHESVSGTTHHYKIYLHQGGYGTAYISPASTGGNTYSSMTLIEIEA